ncbi:MAG TPA: M20/M25/M40 family metallo-hydrolase [Clostridia bacterium]|nr:M20/M25/M40 family metallo-hydrolase [Clostridia bacterium]
MIDVNRLINTFLELVNINSPSLKEKKLADYLVKKLSSLGFEVYIDEAGKNINGETGNVIGKKKGNNKKEPLLFSAHMDTVQPTEGIKTVIESGIIKTDGTTILGADDKAGIAAFLEAMECIKENNLSHPDLEVVFSVAEEIGLLGAKYLDYGKLSSKIAFVLDSGGPPGTIITRSPAQVDLSITVKGKAAHAGVNPEDGINAIAVASKALSQLKIGRIDEETTSNIGIINGGKATNIVPDEVRIYGEIRSMNKDKLNNLVEFFKNSFEITAAEEGANIIFKTETGFEDYNLDINSKAVNLAIKAAEKCKLNPVLAARGGGSDTNVFNLHGIEAVNLGVGICNDHTDKEYISIENLVNCAKLIIVLACN